MAGRAGHLAAGGCMGTLHGLAVAGGLLLVVVGSVATIPDSTIVRQCSNHTR